jgi:hypothetical protein
MMKVSLCIHMYIHNNINLGVASQAAFEAEISSLDRELSLPTYIHMHTHAYIHDDMNFGVASQAAFEAEISSLDRELSLLRSVHETEGEGLNEELSALNVSHLVCICICMCMCVCMLCGEA